MVTQFYIVEVQQYANGEFGHIVHFAWDEDPEKAQLKGESKFYEVLAAAAVSDLPCHSAIMFSTEGFPLMNKCYKHDVQPEPEPEPEPTPEPEVVEGEGEGE